VIFDPTGKVLAKAYHEYTVDMPQPGWAEQDGERVWRLAQDCLRRAIAAAGIQTAAAVAFRCKVKRSCRWIRRAMR